MKKVTVIGHFGFGLNYNDGQTVKTKNITSELCRVFGANIVDTIDTHGGFTALLKAPAHILKSMRDSNNIVILPAQRGILVYSLLISVAKCFCKSCKVHYAVVGGWLPNVLEKYKLLNKQLRRFDYIYVETATMEKRLISLGLNNTAVMPNFKDIKPIDVSDISFSETMPYKLCIFSRVMREKGIEDAVNVVRRINEKEKQKVYALDIFGPIDPQQKEWFDDLQKTFPEYICYRGVVASSDSVNTVRKYDALVFPTRFFTEGIPGTIVDAYASGVPVICSKWESFSDIVDEGQTGKGYEFSSENSLYELMSNHELLMSQMKTYAENCLRKSQEYLPQNGIKVLIKNMQV